MLQNKRGYMAAWIHNRIRQERGAVEGPRNAGRPGHLASSLGLVFALVSANFVMYFSALIFTFLKLLFLPVKICRVGESHSEMHFCWPTKIKKERENNREFVNNAYRIKLLPFDLQDDTLWLAPPQRFMFIKAIPFLVIRKEIYLFLHNCPEESLNKLTNKFIAISVGQGNGKVNMCLTFTVTHIGPAQPNPWGSRNGNRK